jgi:outer membrane receptor protein involved in Fe transport
VVDNPVLSILPSVNTSYNLTKNTLVRFSYGMNVNRPEFRELAPFAFYNFDLSADIIGNAELEVATIHNLDLRYEWYPSASEIFAFGGFYKKFFDPIETIITTGADNPIFIYNNAAEAENFGVEMELRKNLDFISENLRNVGLSMNAALIKSQITLSEDDATLTQAAVRPLQGQSPYVVNAGLYYQTTSGKTQINANYNVSGKRIFLVGDNEFPTQWEMPRNLIDISITQQLTPSTTLRLGVSDLLNARYWVAEDANQDGKINSVVDQTVIETRTGQYIQLGINVKF